jgi:pre-rRNA-processing protein TSR1
MFSQHTNGSKHKFERFWRSDNSTIVMTLFAPIMYPPCSILVYQEVHGGRQDLVGTGSLLSADPDRLVIKRTILSGHPFKVHKRSSVVRFMFFNREDIAWFKPIELRTKQGRRGHIKEALGTHGHMKVAFDGQISQQDTVLLNLYKRVFPKWNYDPFVPKPAVANSELEQAEGRETLQLFKKPRKADLMEI